MPYTPDTVIELAERLTARLPQPAVVFPTAAPEEQYELARTLEVEALGCGLEPFEATWVAETLSSYLMGWTPRLASTEHLAVLAHDVLARILTPAFDGPYQRWQVGQRLSHRVVLTFLALLLLAPKRRPPTPRSTCLLCDVPGEGPVCALCLPEP